MKNIIGALVLTILTIVSFGQESYNYKIIKSFGFGGELLTTPAQTYDIQYFNSDTFVNAKVDLYSKMYGYSVNLTFQTNVYELSDEMGISLTIPIKIGNSGEILNALARGGDNKYHGFAYLSVPLTADFNYGIGSTYRSRAEHGFSGGIGAHIYYFPLIAFEEGFNISSYKVNDVTYTNNDILESIKLKKLFVSPILKLSYRFWTKNSTAYEIGTNFSIPSKFTINEFNANTKVDIKNAYCSLYLNVLMDY